ncbi:MAG: hypothetical protein EBT73_07305, partial [Actinobacteria bacterium]|nr:hypothetical protein [Actinomycetota bacterium]
MESGLRCVSSVGASTVFAVAISLADGIDVIVDTASSAEHDLDGTTLRMASGGSLCAKLVVDASGSGVLLAHRAGLGRRSNGHGVAQHGEGAQTAYGLVLGNSHHLEPDVFTLMDWRPAGGNAAALATFFYGARFTDGSTLVEETSLYAQPPHNIEDLRKRLA